MQLMKPNTKTRAELEAIRDELIAPGAPEGLTIGAMLEAWDDMMKGSPEDRAVALGLAPGHRVRTVTERKRR
jgi:hypothetical protein